MSIKEGLDKVGQESCYGNQDNVINGEDIQTPVVVDTREVYQEGEICSGTKRSRTLMEKDKEYQLKILFEKRKKLHARMTRKCKLIDNLIYSSSNVTTVKEVTDQFNDQFKRVCVLAQRVCWSAATRSG